MPPLAGLMSNVVPRSQVIRGIEPHSVPPLVQRLEERNELVDLLLGEVQVGHAAALLAGFDLLGADGIHGLLSRRVAQPGLEIRPVELAVVVGADLVGLDNVVAVQVLPEVECRAGEGTPAGEVRQVGGLVGHQLLGAVAPLLEVVVVDAPCQVAHRALGGEQVGAGPGLVVGGHVGLVLLVLEPGLELVGRQGDHALAHVTVRQPAVLGALAHVGAGLVGVDGERVRAPGYGVLLAVELGDPERVDHVAGRDLQAHVLARGDDQVVGGEHVVVCELAVAIGVVGELPPPLLAGHLDGEVVVGVLDVQQRRDGGEGHEAEQQGGEYRPADLELGVAVRLPRQLVGVVVLALPELEHQVQHPELHQHEDDGGDEEDGVDEVVDLAGDRSLGLEGVLWGVRRARAQQQEQRHQQGECPAMRASAMRLSAGSHPPSSVTVRPSSGSWNSRSPLTAPPIPTPITATAATSRTATIMLRLSRGREAKKNPATMMTVAMPMPTHTAASADSVRKIRENAATTTPIASRPAAGNSIGFMRWLRICRLVAGSPVARSAQVCTAHSTSTMPRATRPKTKRTGDATRPTITSATPNAVTAGQ